MIEVYQDKGFTFISKDGLTQSMIPSPSGGYWEKMIPDDFIPQTVLILGLGAGTIVNILKEKFPEIHITAVDNNKEMISLSNVYSLVNLTLERDAFDYMEECSDQFSLIIVDLFDGMKFDMKVITDLFLNDCKRCLKPGGYLVVNVPNLSQCELNFHEAKRNDVQNIYFFRASV